jgi:hypothetical protein
MLCRQNYDGFFPVLKNDEVLSKFREKACCVWKDDAPENGGSKHIMFISLENFGTMLDRLMTFCLTIFCLTTLSNDVSSNDALSHDASSNNASSNDALSNNTV